MLFNVKIVSSDEYADYLKKLQDAGNIGPALGGSEVDQQEGLESEGQNNDESTGASE